MSETYEQSIERRAREIFPHDFEPEGPFTTVIRNDQMMTCGPMREDMLHFISMGTYTPEQSKASACQIIRENDADNRRIEAQVEYQVSVYRALGYFDRKPWWKRLFS